MDLFGIGSILGGAASLFGVGAAAKTSAEDRQFTREENQKNRDFTERMWNLQNAYNTPSAQIGRIMDAGLNPALAYGSVSDGMASSAPTPSTSSNPNPSQLPSAIAAAAQQFSQIDVLQSQAEKNRADADAAQAEAERTRRNNKLFDATYSAQVESAFNANKKTTAEINLLSHQIGLLDEQAIGQRLTNEFNSRTLMNRVQMNFREADKLNALIEQINADKEYKQTAMQFIGYDAVTKRISANAAGLNAQAYANLVPFLAQMYKEQGYLAGVQGDFIDSDAHYASVMAQAYSMYTQGDLTAENVERAIVDTFNIRAFGTDKPGEGMTGVKTMAAQIIGMFHGGYSGRWAYSPYTYPNSYFRSGATYDKGLFSVEQGRQRRRTPRRPPDSRGKLLRPPKQKQYTIPFYKH